MAQQEDFTYDAETFVVGGAPMAAEVRKLEADYAELFMEALAKGPIGPDVRAQLDRSAEIFGLDRARLAQIEQAMQADFEARRPDSSASAATSSGPASSRAVAPSSAARPVDALPDVAAGGADAGAIAPFADEATDPRLHALGVRIAFLEAQNTELLVRCNKLETRNAVLEERLLGLTVDFDLTDVSAAKLARLASGASGATPVAASEAGPAGVDLAALAASASAARHPRPSELDAVLQQAPRDVQALHRLYHGLKRAADTDRRYCVAHALVYLGAADAEERATFERGHRGTLIQPTAAVTPEDWKDLVRHPEQDELIGEIYAEIAPAVLLARVASARRDATLPELDESRRLEPRTSSLLAARSVSWSAAVLGLTAPAVYADPSYAGLVEMVFTTPLCSRLGAMALAPRAPRELAFAMGRHLTWYRRESFMSVLAASVEALEDLFLAALSIGNPGLPMASGVRRRIEPVANAIEPLLEPPASLRLRAAFLRFVEQGGRTNLRRWAIASDRTAARAGLVLSDDLAAAHTMLDLEEASRLDERMDDLLAFCVGERYAVLRRKIGVNVADG